MGKVKTFFITLLSTIIILVTAAAIYLLLFSEEPVNITTNTVLEHEIVAQMEYDSSVNPTVITNSDDSYYFITKDGLFFKNSLNENLWQDTYSFNKVFAKGSENYVLVTETLETNTEIFVYDLKGLVYSITDTTDEIAYVDINDNGYTNVIFNRNNGYTLNVYDNVGTLIFSHLFEDGYIIPLTCALSNDNKTLFVNQLDTSQLFLSTLCVYFNIEDPKSNGIFNVQTFSDDYFYMTDFLNNNQLATISDKNIFIMTLENNKVIIESEIELKNKIKYAFIENEHIVVVYDEPLSNMDSYFENTIQIINNKGEINTLLNAENITYLNGSNDTFVVGSNNTFYFYNYNGKPIWNYYSSYIPNDVLLLEKGTLGVFSGVNKMTNVKYNK